MPGIGDMVVRIVGDNSGLDKSIDNSKSKLTSFGDSAQKVGRSLSLFVTAPIVALGAAALKSASDMENQQAAFETMLGSAEKARDMLKSLTDLSARTPFQLGDLSNAAKTMLSFGIETEKILPNLQMLGDIAQGDKNKLDSLTLAFSQIQSTGRLMGQDLLQLINAGFNPLQVISEKTGKSMAVLKEEMSKGAISAEDVADAFKTATSEGGRFYGGMQKASQTLSGQISTLKDNVGALGRSLISELMPVIKDIVATANEWAKKFANLSTEQKKLILTIAGIAAAAGPAVSAIGGMAKGLGVVQKIITTLSGPAGLVALLVAGVAGLVILLKSSKTALDLEKTSLNNRKKALEEVNTQQKTANDYLQTYVDLSSQQAILEKIRLQTEVSGARNRNKNISEMLATLSAITAEESDSWFIVERVLEDEKLREEVLKRFPNLQRLSIARQIEALRVVKESLETSKEENNVIAENARVRIQAIDQLLEGQKKETQTTKEVVEVNKELKAVYDEHAKALDVIRKKDEEGLFTAGQWLQERLAEQEKYVEALIEQGVVNQKEIELLKELRTQFALYQEAQQATVEQEKDDQKELIKNQKEFVKTLKDTENEYKRLGSLIAGYVSPILQEIGKQLVQDEFSWKSVAKAAVESVANVIRALAEQAAVQAAIELAKGNVVAAGLWTAASAAGFIAAGAVAGLANQINTESPSATTPNSTTDNFQAGASDIPTTQPEENMINLTVEMDSEPILNKIFPATQNGNILISARAVV